RGTTTYTEGSGYGSVASFACDIGYRLEGAAVALCGETGQWNESSPVCRVVDCRRLESPDNVMVTYPSGLTIYLSEARLSCFPGFDLQGPSIALCTETGKWNITTTPFCDIKNCGSLEPPVNGSVRLTTGTTYLSRAIYFCDTGFNVTGALSRRCGNTGSWEPQNPTTCTIK
ncbi:SVEP1-like protein, partial [Mya arenaria]